MKKKSQSQIKKITDIYTKIKTKYNARHECTLGEFLPYKIGPQATYENQLKYDKLVSKLNSLCGKATKHYTHLEDGVLKGLIFGHSAVIYVEIYSVDYFTYHIICELDGWDVILHEELY